MNNTSISLNTQAMGLFQPGRATHRVAEWFGLAKARVTAAYSNPSAEAEALREYAHTYVKTDPSFAEDLYAAADRHERKFVD